jgi:type III secretory pathway component EscS
LPFRGVIWDFSGCGSSCGIARGGAVGYLLRARTGAEFVMNKNAKIYLITSVVLLALGLVAALTNLTDKMPVLFVPFPVGAVFFGLFLVSAFLGKEAEQFAKEQQEKARAAGLKEH